MLPISDGAPHAFATNTLVIVTPPGNPAGVGAASDLAAADTAVALCDPSAPCGAAAQRVLDRAGIEVVADTFEEDVKAVLTKVSLGEVDAGLVYDTDAQLAGDDVRAVAIDQAAEVVNTYPIAVLAGSPVAFLAREWVDLTLSEAGQRVLADHGFGSP